MSSKLVIEEIPDSATIEEVFEFFSAIGSVLSVTESKDGNTSASHAWVIEMSSLEEANSVIEQLNDVLNIRLAA